MQSHNHRNDSHHLLDPASNGWFSCSPWVIGLPLTTALLRRSRRSASSHVTHMTSSAPCSRPVTTNVAQLLQRVPSRMARLAAKIKLPGVWMHIMGILRLPTCLRRHVVASCGMYCIDASTVLCTPSEFAHPTSASLGSGGEFGSDPGPESCCVRRPEPRRAMESVADARATKCTIDSTVTVIAVFCDGVAGDSTGAPRLPLPRGR